MSIIINDATTIMIQGITGKQGRFHAAKLIDSGSNLVAGVSPSKAGETVEKIPVFDNVAHAIDAYPNINASLILVPHKYVYNSAMEAINAQIPLIVIITEFVPVHDSLKLINAAHKKGVRILGPNTIGIISPGYTKVGIMPSYIYSQGKIGIISRSGTLTHEMASNLTFKGYGQSTCVDIGGDPLTGMSYTQLIDLFEEDNETELIIMIGEIGGINEETAASYIYSKGIKKPIIAYIAGRNAPEGIKMGHAGAIISGNTGTAYTKIKALKNAGVLIGETMGHVLEHVEAINRKFGDILMTVQPKVENYEI